MISGKKNDTLKFKIGKKEKKKKVGRYVPGSSRSFVGFKRISLMDLELSPTL